MVNVQVKWAGYEDKYNTWEPTGNIKPFITQYYEGKNYPIMILAVKKLRR